MTRADSDAQLVSQTDHTYKPLLAVQILFDVSSPTITSHRGLSNVPGTEIQGALSYVSSTSQTVHPEDGRSTIGTCAFKLIDNTSPQTFTDELREQLGTYNQGPRDAEARLFMGFGDDFNDFRRVGTFYVSSIDFNRGEYTVKCKDKNKFLREEIMEPKTIFAGAEISEDGTTITTNIDPAAEGFQTIDTHAGWQDGASGTFGWIMIKSTGEVIRYTGISQSPPGFTGCVRGRFNTKPQAVEFDEDDPEEIQEFIYLEGPAVWCARAMLTGEVDPTISPVPRLPDHWNLGLDASDLTDEWENIGADLYDQDDLTTGFPVRFTHLESTDGKAFIEREIYRLIGVFAPVNILGQFRLKRISSVVETNAPFQVNDDYLLRVSSLKHDLQAVRNNYSIEWNFDGEDLTRRLILTDNISTNRHGQTTQTKIAFRGLHTARHTKSAIIGVLTIMRDRYSEPPIRIDVTVPWMFNRVELGDLVRVECSTLRDFSDVDASGTDTLNRVFEIQSVRIDWKTGAVSLKLFASTREVGAPIYNDENTAVIRNAWYESEGTDISTLVGYSGGTTLAGYDFTGHASDVNDSTAIFYHVGDLNLVNCTLAGNVQIRCTGTITVFASLDGAGGGHTGVADTDTLNGTSTKWAKEGTDGWLGPNRSGSGLWYFGNVRVAEIEGRANGLNAAAPRVILFVNEDGDLTSKFPKDLQGTGGAPGAQCIEANAYPVPSPPLNPSDVGFGGRVNARGGQGGNGGAGLVFVCRGLAYSTGARIDLSGEPGKKGETTSIASSGHRVFDLHRKVDNVALEAGCGAAGTPGVMLVILDGDITPYPDIRSSNFIANQFPIRWRGTQPQSVIPATPPVSYGSKWSDPGLPYPSLTWELWQFRNPVPVPGTSPPAPNTVSGFHTNALKTGSNLWRAAHTVQYVPDTRYPENSGTPRPKSLAVSPTTETLTLLFNQQSSRIKETEVWASDTNERSFAERVAVSNTGEARITAPGGRVKFYWIRNVGFDDTLSGWYPESDTAGIEGQALSVSSLLPDVYMNDKESWDYINTALSPDEQFRGMEYFEQTVFGSSKARAWGAREGGADVVVPTPEDLFAKKRQGPSEFDIALPLQSTVSPPLDTSITVSATGYWSWEGAMNLGLVYVAFECYSPDGTSIAVPVELIGNKDWADSPAGQLLPFSKTFTIAYSPLGNLSPVPETPHFLRFGLRFYTSAVSPVSPPGRINVWTCQLNIVS